MKPRPPYLVRALLDLLVFVPLLFTAILIGALILGALLGDWFAVPLTLAGGFLLWLAAGFGRRVVTGKHAGYADGRFCVRYQPVLIAGGYTLLALLVASALPASEQGAVFGPFVNAFAIMHPGTSVGVAMATLFSAPSPWLHLAPPLAIYAAYAAGMSSGFRRLSAAPLSRRGPVLCGLGVCAVLGVVALRMAHLGRDVLMGDRRPALSEEFFTHHYQPFVADNRLVRVDAPTLSITADYPRVDGATALYPIYAAAAQAIYAGLDRSTVQDFVFRSRTPRAYERLINGEVDLILVAQPSVEQRAMAEAAGVTLSLTPIGKEAFVFFVHQDNPVPALTSAQIRDIYTKRVVNWSALGGRDEPIMPFQRPGGSGSQTAMLAHVMRGEPLPAPLREEYSEGMGGVLQRVANYRNAPGAIGYSFRVFATVMSPITELKLLAVDGVAPTAESIRDNSYPFTANLYVVTAGTQNPHVPGLIDWLRGPQGQALVAATGYVPLDTPASGD
ncbi:MAG: substrate-binding domain-containing protein [Verrucomicrobiota bacterium]